MFRSRISSLLVLAAATTLLAVSANPAAAQYRGGGGSYRGGYAGHYYGGYADHYYGSYGYFPGIGISIGSGYYGGGYPGYNRYYYSDGPTTDYSGPYAPGYYAPAARFAPVIPTEGIATVVLHVPSDAKVWFDDTATSANGGDWRTFETPPISVDKIFHYTVRAQWTEKGQMVEQSRRVNVEAGQRTSVDFTVADSSPISVKPR